MDCVALWFEDSDQFEEERQQTRDMSDIMNIDHKSFKFNLKNLQIFSFLVLLKIFV